MLPNTTKMGRMAYQAYGETTDFKNFQGNPMPAYDDLTDRIKSAWENAAAAVWYEAMKEAPLSSSRQPIQTPDDLAIRGL